MRAVATIEARTGVRLSPRALIFQTLESIAHELDRALASRAEGSRPAPRDGAKTHLIRKLVSALTTKKR